MGSDLARVIISAALATFNPSLLAATTAMLLLSHPKRLMLGYLLGAYTTSMAVGIAFVFELHGSGVVRTSKRTLSPAADIAIGAIALTISLVLVNDRDAALRRWLSDRKERKSRKRRDGVSWQQRMLDRESAWITFVLGAALSFPGVTYLNALSHIVKLDPGAVFAVLLVIFFCVMQQLLIELPLLSYVFAPEWTPAAVARTRAWFRRRGRTIGQIALAVIGLVLVVKGLTTIS